MLNFSRDPFARCLPQKNQTIKPAQTAIRIALSSALLAMVVPAVHAAPNSTSDAGTYAKGRILIEPFPGLSPADLASVLAVHGGRAKKLGQSNLHVVELSGVGNEQAVVQKLSHDHRLKFAELDKRVKSTFVPNDPYLGSEYHLTRVGAPTAWDTTRGAGVTIAILDSGVDGSHPDLIANLVPGFNLVDNNTDTSDICGHGTAVAGTAAASINNGIGVAGVAGEAKIMPLRIAYFDTTANGCYAYYSTIANGLTYAADHGARIANISYSGVAGSSAIQSAAQYLKGKSGLVFVSAGNNGIDENITPTTTMIPVSATDANDVITSWSSFGSFVALSAPGAGIWTTSKGGIYQAWNGTSFSSPLSAGVGALLMAANPSLDGATVEKLLYSSSVDLGVAGRDPYYGYGRVSASAGVAAALSTVMTVDTTKPVASVTAPLASSTVSGLVAVNVTATDNVGVTRVELQVNGATVAIDTATPYGFSWNSASVPNGMVNLSAVAYDAAGNAGASQVVSVNVANNLAPVVADTTPPVVTISNPVAGYVSGTVTISSAASDNSGAAGITQALYIDGVLKLKTTGASLAYSWSTRKVATGTHLIEVTATDAAGNHSTASVQVKR